MMNQILFVFLAFSSIAWTAAFNRSTELMPIRVIPADLMGSGSLGDFFNGGIFPDVGTNLAPKVFGGSLFGYIGSIFSPTSFLGGSFNRVRYCVITSKISYACVLPNIKFFVYTQLVSFPVFIPWLAFIGPLLSTTNIVYLLLNYLPYIIKDTICVVKAILLGGILPTPNLPLNGLPWSLPIGKNSFLSYLNSTLGDNITVNDTMLIENFSDLDTIF